MILKKIVNYHKLSNRETPIYSKIQQEILLYYGYELSEFEAFGLGAGLGFEYAPDSEFILSSDIYMNQPHISGSFSKDRRRLAKNLRIWLDVYRGNCAEKTLNNLWGLLSLKNPVIVEVCLPQYSAFMNERYPDFQEECADYSIRYCAEEEYYLYSYMLIAVGIDMENHVITCLDMNRSEPVEIPFEAFLKMHSAKNQRFHTEFEWTLIIVPKHKEILPKSLAIHDAIVLDIWEMENAYRFGDRYYIGMDAINVLLSDISRGRLWDSDFQKAIGRTYYCSEVLYNKTGLNRKIYAQYLHGAKAYYPKLSLAADAYAELAKEWSDFLEQAVKCAQSSCDRSNVETLLSSSLQKIIKQEKAAIILLKNGLDIPQNT